MVAMTTRLVYQHTPCHSASVGFPTSSGWPILAGTVYPVVSDQEMGELLAKHGLA